MNRWVKLGVFLAFVATSMSLISNVYAAENNSVSNQKTVDMGTTAIELPDGGFLFGPGVFRGKDSQGHKFTVDPKTTSYKVTTVEIAKADQEVRDKKESTNNPLVESKIFLPTGDTSLSPTSAPVLQANLELQPNQGYYGTMNGSGWRYARYWFYPSENSGKYLRWESHGDSGMILNLWETPSSGSVISDGQVRYLSGPTIGIPLTFASYNPAQYSYFYVGNW